MQHIPEFDGIARPPRRGLVRALGPGLVGASALTLVHEGARRVLPLAPRMDTLGRRALVRTGLVQPVRFPWGRKQRARLQRQALLGDVLSNTLYYALVAWGRPQRPLLRGTLLGGLACWGGVVLPPLLGLGRAPSGRSRATRVMTVAWYLLGGLTSALATRRLTARPA